MKVSIVIPAHNPGLYLIETLNSVLAQKMNDQIEIILVDDSDSKARIEQLCGHLFGALAVTILQIPPCNLCQARNRGMDAAVGEYAMFVDDDDLLLPGAVDALYEKAAETKSDMVYGGYQRIGREGEVLKHYPHEYIEGSGREMTRLYLRDTCYTHGGAYLLSREMLLRGAVRYRESICYSEDKIFLIDAFCSAAKVSCVRREVYGYRLNFSSSLFKASPRRFDMIEVDRMVRVRLTAAFPDMYRGDVELDEMLQRTILFCVKTVLWLGMPFDTVRNLIDLHHCFEPVDDRMSADLVEEVRFFQERTYEYFRYQKEHYRPNGLTKLFKEQHE